jgi:hypothetical protein
LRPKNWGGFKYSDFGFGSVVTFRTATSSATSTKTSTSFSAAPSMLRTLSLAFGVDVVLSVGCGCRAFGGGSLSVCGGCAFSGALLSGRGGCAFSGGSLSICGGGAFSGASMSGRGGCAFSGVFSLCEAVVDAPAVSWSGVGFVADVRVGGGSKPNSGCSSRKRPLVLSGHGTDAGCLAFVFGFSLLSLGMGSSPISTTC